MQFKKQHNRTLFHIFCAFIIYPLAVPLFFLDVSLELYHRICFPLYGIPYVKRGDYIRLDRQKLQYLSKLEQFNCAYCGYANGFVQYAQRIAAETERYWCGIRHKQNGNFHEPPHHENFLPYDDERSFRDFLDS